LLTDIWVEGEVSQLFHARSGHIYFTLRDDESQIKCVLFRAHSLRQRMLPKVGQHITVHGQITLYEREGTIQLYADVIQPTGIGLAAMQLEQLRQRLTAEGLFEASRKRPLPAAPRVIGIVTSPDGAVWHDIQHVIGRRYPLARLVFAPTVVQGTRAAAAIVAALDLIQTDLDVEVVILARGGGSAEDLWVFNDERVVRAIFACRVPVVSGVGHETDWTLADEVADVRAPTPSAAAEICVPSIVDLAQLVNTATERIADLALDQVGRHAARLQLLSAQLAKSSPAISIQANLTRIDAIRLRQANAFHRRYSAAVAGAERTASMLRALDPVAVLGRGYVSLSDPETGAPIGSVSGAVPDRPFIATFADGTAAGLFTPSARPHPAGQPASSASA
jgi:exodeoxyribonuclease VII large subunit